MKISILLPGNTNKPTGGYKVIYEYCNKLVEFGHEVCIYYYYGPMFEGLHLPENIRRICVKKFSELMGPGLWFKLNPLIKKKVIDYSTEIEPGDVVIATAQETANDVKELPKNCGSKVYFVQDFENWNRSDEEVLATYKFDMTKITIANWLKELIDKYSQSKAYLVSNGINTSIFCDKGYKRKPHSLVYQYRSASYKGPDTGIEVIKALEEQYEDLTVEMISNEKKPKNLPKCCRFHRNISPEKVADINNNCQVFMCTSVKEGFGLPGLEALACGLALASTNYKGALEYAKDKENALLSRAGDAQGMVQNIVELFENEALRSKLTKNGIETAKSMPMENSARKFEKILLDL